MLAFPHYNLYWDKFLSDLKIFLWAPDDNCITNFHCLNTLNLICSPPEKRSIQETCWIETAKTKLSISKRATMHESSWKPTYWCILLDLLTKLDYLSIRMSLASQMSSFNFPLVWVVYAKKVGQENVADISYILRIFCSHRLTLLTF